MGIASGRVGIGFLLIGSSAAAPFLLPAYYLGLVANALVLAIGGLGLHVLQRTGVVSFGHATYFGLGAYAGGFAFSFWPSFNSFEAYLALGPIVPAAVAALFGLICVRTTRIYFAILTLSFGQLVHALFISGAIFRLFGGEGRGLFLIGEGGLYIPRLAIIGRDLSLQAFDLALYYIILAGATLTAAVLWRIDRSAFGMALRAIGQNESRALFIAVPVRMHRWYAYVISAVFTGLAGALSGELYQQITPQHLYWVMSIQLVIVVILGGVERFWGPVVGGFALTAIQEIALRMTLYRGFVLGGLLIAIVLRMPRGLLGWSPKGQERSETLLI